MAWRSKSKVRKNAIKHGYRSGFEHKVADQLNEQKIKFEYETTVIDYIKPQTNHTYTIDFTLPNGILVETKGRWVAEDRKKHLLIKKQHPELDIRIVFQSAKGKIRNGMDRKLLHPDEVLEYGRPKIFSIGEMTL